jgi:hypothetical protein
LLVTIDILNCKRVAHCGGKMIVLIDVAIFAIDMEVWFPATHKGNRGWRVLNARATSDQRKM